MFTIRNITLDITCPFCGEIRSVRVDERGYHAWRNGELVQRAFPYLSATEREQVISLICPNCQKDVFGE